MDCMIDIETLGTRHDAAIVSIAAVPFDLHGDGPLWRPLPYVRHHDLDSAIRYGSVDGSTVGWWIRTRPPMPPVEVVSLEDSLYGLYGWIRGGVYPYTDPFERIWAKSPSFDMVILDSAYREVGLEAPWSFRQWRDVRTATDISGIRTARPALPHDPLADALAQIHDVQAAYRRFDRQD